MTDEGVWIEDDNPELTDSGAALAKRIADLDSITLCEYMGALVQAWRYWLRGQRTNDVTNSYRFASPPELCGNGQALAEEAITELWKVYGWDQPFNSEIWEKVQEKTEFYAQQNEKHRNAHDAAVKSLETFKKDGQAHREKIDDELRRLIVTIDEMLNQEVTHQERRGQLKLMQTVITAIRNRLGADLSDIPF